MSFRLPHISGLGLALPTPFLQSGEIDFNSLKSLLIHTEPAHYWVIQGTTGEVSTLEEPERNETLAFCLAHNSKNKPIVLGIGGNNTSTIINQVSKVDNTKISAVLSVTPYYNRPTQKGLIAHYTALAESCTVPIIMYNVPSRTGVDMLPETTAELSKHPNIAGIKEALGSIPRIAKLKSLCDSHFQIISGDDASTVHAIAEGATGVISVLGNAFPAAFGHCINLALKGKILEAISAFEKFKTIDQLLYIEGNPAGIKELLYLLGMCTPQVRLPLLPASTALHQELKKALHAYQEIA
jgi:4-hydroxy-tetrahydrodipicolinate synthase